MASMTYDPSIKYGDDESFNVRGPVLNDISTQILHLRKKVTDLEEADEKQELTDLRIRDKNPAVKDAWDQYQTVLRLAVSK